MATPRSTGDLARGDRGEESEDPETLGGCS
jgi:hypothetical protein